MVDEVGEVDEVEAEGDEGRVSEFHAPPIVVPAASRRSFLVPSLLVVLSIASVGTWYSKTSEDDEHIPLPNPGPLHPAAHGKRTSLPPPPDFLSGGSLQNLPPSGQAPWVPGPPSPNAPRSRRGSRSLAESLAAQDYAPEAQAEAEAEAEAEADVNASAAEAAAARARRSQSTQPRRIVRIPEGRAGVDGATVARRCRYDQRCIVRELQGRTDSPLVLSLLADAYLARGQMAAYQRTVRILKRLYPRSREARHY